MGVSEEIDVQSSDATSKAKIYQTGFDRIVRDVCAIFEEITGSEAISQREGGAIVPWARDHGWQAHDFRLLIEFEFKDPRRREYLNQPGRMNLRTIFNPLRKDILIDTLVDLRRAKQIAKKAAENTGADIMLTRIRSHCCGKILTIVHHKRFDRVSKETPFYWETDNSEYGKHECFSSDQLQL